MVLGLHHSNKKCVYGAPNRTRTPCGASLSPDTTPSSDPARYSGQRRAASATKSSSGGSVPSGATAGQHRMMPQKAGLIPRIVVQMHVDRGQVRSLLEPIAGIPQRKSRLVAADQDHCARRGRCQRCLDEISRSAVAAQIHLRPMPGGRDERQAHRQHNQARQRPTVGRATPQVSERSRQRLAQTTSRPRPRPESDRRTNPPCCSRWRKPYRPGQRAASSTTRRDRSAPGARAPARRSARPTPRRRVAGRPHPPRQPVGRADRPAARRRPYSR